MSYILCKGNWKKNAISETKIKSGAYYSLHVVIGWTSNGPEILEASLMANFSISEKFSSDRELQIYVNM